MKNIITDHMRTWAEISLDAIEHNVNAVKARFAPNTRLMCVIKADGYGHGAIALAEFLADKCDHFAVAILEEALALRRAGVTKPILLLGYTSPFHYKEALEAGVSLTIFCEEDAAKLSEIAERMGKRAMLHMKIDTGMGRIGFADTDSSAEQITKIAALPGIEIEGIFTHFACADEAEKASYQEQLRRYEAFLKNERLAEIHSRAICHCCNSAAAMETTVHFDMVRFGVALYGLYPSEEVNRSNLPLQPAMSWKTCVAHLKTVPPGTGVSYGHTFVTNRETRVATLPIGYADGYPRALSNQGHVLIRGQFAPIIGRVCMDQCMVDVTDIPDVQREDEVILLGKAGEREITMEEIGAKSASFNYETACRVGHRVPRVYVYQGVATCMRYVGMNVD